MYACRLCVMQAGCQTHIGNNLNTVNTFTLHYSESMFILLWGGWSMHSYTAYSQPVQILGDVFYG